ncbi:MAG: alpha/beta fold hydrolase [Muribaculaceae bacterium]|nr:alpha/beta fold hydrolase [Muribaculaceae bacterium]
MEAISKEACAKTVLLFVHGIVGNNRFFDFLLPLVQDKYEVAFVDLKGHGGNALDFSKASMEQWKTQVEKAVENLSRRFSRIVGVGHSMGCLLLMEQAALGLMSGLFLLNPPMRISPKIRMFSNILKVATGNLLNDPVAAAAKKAYSISFDFNPLHYYGWPSRYLELFAEAKRAKKNLIPCIQIPVDVILSRRDEMVSPSSAEVLANLPDVKMTILPNSTHYYYPAEDRKQIEVEFRHFLFQQSKHH